MYYNNKNKGVSLLIAILFSSALMLMTAGLTQTILHGIRARGDEEKSGKLFYLAATGKEAASYWAKTRGVGANSSDDPNSAVATKIKDFLYETAGDVGVTNCADTDPIAMGDQPCMDFGVTGRSDTQITLNGLPYYSVPISATGSAAKERGTNGTDADDDCNWNKLELGNTVEIPLYYEKDSNGNGVIEDSEVKKLGSGGLNKFLLRVRAPKCDSSNISGQCDFTTNRILLYPKADNSNSDFRDIDRDPVLIQWMIRDEGGDDSMIASDAKSRELNEKNKRPPLSEVNKATLNTELTAGRINEAGTPGGGLFDFAALDETQIGEYINSMSPQKLISEFLSKPEIKKPVLRLNLVDRPRIANCQTTPLTDLTYTESQYSKFVNDSHCNVPYLEYQLLTKEQVSDSKSVLSGTVKIGDFTRNLKTYLPHEAPLGGFALESF